MSGQKGPGHGAPGAPGRSGAGAKRPAGVTACRLGGSARHGLGPAHLGETRARMTKALGKPGRTAYGIAHFCDLAVHFGKKRRADFIASTTRSFHAGRARVGAKVAVRGKRVLAHRGANYVLTVNHRGWRLLIGTDRGKVTFLAAVSSRLTLRRLGGLLIAAGR